uniref:Uncharacterized protein n=1 Tax=Theileria annulata TaxID=5874 RepID=A0A3B0N745_THEAN
MINIKAYVYILIFNIVLFSKFVHSYHVFNLRNPDQNLIESVSDQSNGPVTIRIFRFRHDSNVTRIMFFNEVVWTSRAYLERVLSIRLIISYDRERLMEFGTINGGFHITHFFRRTTTTWREITLRGFTNLESSIREERILDIKGPFDNEAFEYHYNHLHGLESHTFVVRQPYNVHNVSDGNTFVWFGNRNLKCLGAIVHGTLRRPHLIQLNLIRANRERSRIYLRFSNGVWYHVTRSAFYRTLAMLDAEEEQRRRLQNVENQ